MVSPLIILLALVLQQPASLTPGERLTAEITKESEQVRTPLLDSNYAEFPVLGVPFALKVPADGSYTIELESPAFDTYLVLRDSEGKVLAQDDDGLWATHSEISGKFRSAKDYVVQACALHGEIGEFQIVLLEGRPKKLSAKEKREKEMDYWIGRKAYLESVGQDRTAKYASALESLAEFLVEAGKKEGIEDLYRECLEIRLEVLEADDPWIGIASSNYALFLKNHGRFKEALPLYQRAVESFSAEFGPDHFATATVSQNLGMLYLELGDYKAAREVLEKAKSNLASQFGKVSPGLAATYNGLGQLELRDGNHKAAQENMELALECQELAIGKDHPDLAITIGNLGLILQERGNYAEAFALCTRAVELWEKGYGEDHPELAKYLNSLGMLSDLSGDLPQARRFYERAMEILIKAYGPDHRDIILPLLNSAYVAVALGKFEEALEQCERAIQICRKNLGNDDPQMFKCMEALASVYNHQGEVDRCVQITREAIAAQEELYGPDHLQLSVSLLGLASYLGSAGEEGETEKLIRRGLAILEKSFGRRHERTAGAISQLASRMRAEGNYEAALAFAEEAMGIEVEALGPEHPSVASALSKVASIKMLQGDLEGAADFHRRSLEIRKKTLGLVHSRTASSFRSLGRVLTKQGKYAAALDLFQQSLDSSMQVLDRELPSMTEAGRIRMLRITAKPEELLSALSKVPSADRRSSFESFQRWKGRATRLQAASMKIAQSANGGPELRLRGQIQVLAKQLSNLVLLPLAEQKENHVSQITALREKRLQYEQELNRKLGLDHVLQTPSLEEVQRGLPTNAVLVDFYVGANSFAWVLKPSGAPELIPLGSSNALLQAQQVPLLHATTRGGKAFEGPGETAQMPAIYQKLWVPLLEAIGDSATIFISPDGYLCELPFGILQDEKGEYLLEKHRFIYLDDPTILASKGDPRPSEDGSVLAVGHIDYLQRDDFTEAVHSKPLTRSRVGNSWSSLPATLGEIQAIRDLHDSFEEGESSVKVLNGKAATEERIRAEIPGKRFVHIATHGYFEPDHLPSLLFDAEEKYSIDQLEEQVQAVGLLPGLLSGLVFAGVNGEPDPTRDDGYLSAEEIQYLDLSACDLVVLSACETALGSARAGEGLMSLRRAFTVAGADTVISSLWKVGDQATAELMKDFYTNLWQKNMSRGDALHEAKLRMLRRNRIDNGGDAMPSTWGAFVLSWEWN